MKRPIARTGLIIVALTALLSGHARAQISSTGYTLVDLGPVGGYNMSFASGGNTNAGYAAIFCYKSVGATSQAARYSPPGSPFPAGVQLLLGLGGNTLNGANAVNDLGWVVGSVTTKSGAGRAVLWQGTTAIDLLNGIAGSANGINNLASPQIVGTSSGKSGKGTSGFLWQNGSYTTIPILGGNINDASEVVGSVNGAGAYWKSGMSQGRLLNALIPGGGTAASKINNLHRIVGYAVSADLDERGNALYHAVLWNTDGTINYDLGLANGGGTQGLAINNNGWVAGRYYPPPARREAGFLWDPVNHNFYDVDSLLDHTAYPGWTLGSATGVNDSGQIVGMGLYNGVDRAYLLIPR